MNIYSSIIAKQSKRALVSKYWSLMRKMRRYQSEVILEADLLEFKNVFCCLAFDFKESTLPKFCEETVRFE